ncbi:MAG: ABC transporter ATP-binding protein, partial [Anaerolineae bacterium]
MATEASAITERYTRPAEADHTDLSITDSYLTQMLWRFLKPYRWQILGVLALMFAASGLTLLLPYLIRQAVDGPITSGDLSGLLPLGVVYALAIFGIFGLQFGYVYWLQTIGQNALVNIRQDLFEHIIRQDLAYFHQTPVGKIVARMSNDIEALTELMSTSIIMVISNLITLGGIVIVMFLLNWRLAMVSLAIIPVMLGASLFFRVHIRGVASQFHRIIAAYQAFLNEHFNGMLVVQLFGQQRRVRDNFQTILDDYYNAHLGLRDMWMVYSAVLQILMTIGMALVLWGGGRGALAGWATLGTLIAFIDYVRRSFTPIQELSMQYAQIQTAFSAGERIARMLSVQPTVRPPAEPTSFEDFDQSIDFDSVSFSYKPDSPVLREINLHIEPGQRVAVVGATGAGKTTLVKLLARYYDVVEGAIRVGGVDVRDLATADLRRYVSVVPQDPYCFNGTIAANLRLFVEDLTGEQMREAAAITCADRFIDRLPGGYDFELLPGGANLSQGQRQLLALTRALIHSPESILVLDEATSSIDTETEALIQQGLERVLAERTSVIIAHRLSTVRDADRILVMRQGQIIEDGSHDELLAAGGVY